MKKLPLPLQVAFEPDGKLTKAPGRPSLPRVIWVERQTPLLHPSPMLGDDAVLSLNLAQGCAHRCAFCNARAYPSYPGDEVVCLCKDTVRTLTKELSSRKRLPRAVYISPSTDPFMPLAEVQTLTAEVVELLAGHGVESWLMTRGFIRPAAQETLVRHRLRVKVTLALTTLDRQLQRLLEPLAAPPRMRLRQLARLREAGVPLQIEVAPLLPGLTDTRSNLAELLEALAAIGVDRITAGYMFLRPGILANLAAVLPPPWKDLLEGVYREGRVLESPGVAPARYLHRRRRQSGYATLMALAAPLGIKTSISSITNPDFAGRPSAPTGPRQRLLPYW